MNSFKSSHSSSIPLLLSDYKDYIETIKGLSPRTVDGYITDLKIFFRFLFVRKNIIDINSDDFTFDEINISGADISLIKEVQLQDLHAFISFVSRERENNNNTRSRKIAAVRSLFKYLNSVAAVLEENPADKLEMPKRESRHPNYLTLDESKSLLDVVRLEKNEFIRKRDYAIIVLFLNCGMRLSELVSINLPMIRNNEVISVIGKGNKERTVYLNALCKDALDSYLAVRPPIADPEEPLFVSQQKKRIERRSVQRLVEKHLKKAGLDTNIYSTHKLRHTAATLMYKYGKVDILMLKEILGHENISTTQIYTHVDNEGLKDAVDSNPLSSGIRE